MDLAAILERLERSPNDPRWLRALGGALGVELSRRRPDELGAVLRALSRTPVMAEGSQDGSDDGGFGAGYAAALADVTLSFQAELGAELEDAELARLTDTSPYAEALAALAAGRETVTAIGVAMGKTKSSASRALAVLREAGLVAVLGSGDERSRPHVLTARGRKLMEQATSSSSQIRAARRRAGASGRGARVAGAYASVRKR
jgi:DNA-binding transcriptional ArsR family regulator